MLKVNKKITSAYWQGLFAGKIKKLKDREIKLNINKPMSPVAQGERRIPFSLKESVRAEIKNLEEQDIIEDVISEAPSWWGQLVIVPKSGNKICLCTDMRNANTAIKRTRFPTPTVDDLNFSPEKRPVF